jgi:hypothetical protein
MGGGVCIYVIVGMMYVFIYATDYYYFFYYNCYYEKQNANIITYPLLGIGDRHLDNILLLPSGQLMHVDFGFSFGKDPKHAYLRYYSNNSSISSSSSSSSSSSCCTYLP